MDTLNKGNGERVLGYYEVGLGTSGACAIVKTAFLHCSVKDYSVVRPFCKKFCWRVPAKEGFRAPHMIIGFCTTPMPGKD